MADLPDYYTQTAISEAEAASFKGGLDANKSAAPVSRDIYYATDSKILRVCVVDGTWININALYLLLAGGTMTGNIAMGGHKVTGLGAPAAQDDALRYNRAEIRNAEIKAAAGIVYSKLTLTGGILMADLATAIKNAAAGLVVLDASADVPLAQIPDTLTGKDADTLDGSHLASLFRTIGGDLSSEVDATGDMSGVANINDGDPATNATTVTVNQYAELGFRDVVMLNQFRFGKDVHVSANDDGEITIQYRNHTTLAWVDWVTGKVIPNDVQEWMNWDSSGGTIYCDGIKVICTKKDTGSGLLYLAELEVKYA